MDEQMAERAGIDTSVAHPARRYNYWLGGTDNFPADRTSGDAFARLMPHLRDGVRANRAMLRRVVRHLAAEHGIRQFLDIGSGLPTAGNTHEVAQAVAPESRVVYVDNDPLLARHARSVLTSTPEGRTAFLEADLRDPASILDSAVVRDTLGPHRPVGLVLAAVLQFIPYPGQAKPLVTRLMDALPGGSFLVVTHATHDFVSPYIAAAHEKMFKEGRAGIWARDKDEIAELFEGLDLIPPGIVPSSHWHPGPDDLATELEAVAAWAGVARKP